MAELAVNAFRAKDLIAAPFTPFNKDGEVNFALLQTYADYLTSTKFTGIFVNGTLAEGMSMTVEERKKLAKAWKDASKERLEVIIHVGANCIKDSQELSRHAEEIGATAIAAFTPSYHKPENEDVLVDVMAVIASAAPKTPFYYYDINFFTGLSIDLCKFMTMAKKKIPTLRGLKNSSRELPDAFDCLQVPDCQVLIGTDVQYLSCLALGIPGVIVVSYLGNVFHDMKQAFDAGDIKTARELQGISQTINAVRTKHGGGINVAKAVFKILTGIDVGPVRLPLRELTSDQFKSLKDDIIASWIADISKPRQQ